MRQIPEPRRRSEIVQVGKIHVRSPGYRLSGTLHAFFSKAMAKTEEAGQVSADSIRERLKTIIGEENKRKPLSDRELTEKLVAEGIQISRRTVAKYRGATGKG